MTAGGDVSRSRRGIGCVVVFVGLVAASAANAAAATHVLVGGALVCVLGALTGAIASRRFGDRVPRNAAIVTGVCAVFAFVGLMHGHTRQQARLAVEQRARFHDLRHDFATRARSRGAGIDAIAKLLGHSTLAMAHRYTHIGDPTLREVVRSITAPGSTRNVVNIADHVRAVGA